eukprot:RCo021846
MSQVELIAPLDPKRTYDYFTLPNQLPVLTVSEPGTSVAAASLDVNVGSFSDPVDLPGLTHFIEHMLFLGTEKYPVENSFQRFLSEHGGKVNAYTSLETTNFHFDVSSDQLQEALDRFSTFFMCPLFTASAADREIQAIDSEHSKNLQVDGARSFQFMRDVSNPNFPFSKFATGNLATLQTAPAQKGVDVVRRMIEHYNEHFSANRMRLVVLGKESNAELRQWAEQHFGAIRNTGVPPPRFEGQPFTEKELGYWYNLIPVLNTRVLTLLFPMPVGAEEYRCKALNYLAHLIGHVGEGSILQALKARQWANGLGAGCGLRGSTWSLFTVDIELTAEGMEHAEEVISICFAYIEMLREAGFQEYIYEELKNIAEMNFRFAEPGAPMADAILVSGSMTYYPPEHSIAGEFLFFEQNPEMVRRCMDHLTPTNMIVFHKAKELESLCDQLGEPHYGMKFGVRRMTPAQLQGFLPSPERPRPADLFLPKPNPFISKDFSMKPMSEVASWHPRVVYEASNGLVKLWYRQSFFHSQPKASLTWNYVTRVAYATPRQRLLNRLFVLMAREAMQSLVFQASVAQLELDISATVEGIRITVRGFNDTLGLFAKQVFWQLFNTPLDEDVFSRIREQTKLLLQNMFKDQAYKMALEQTAVTTTMIRWEDHDLLPLVDGLAVGELEAYIRSLMSQGFVECFVHGNMLEQEAVQLVQELEATYFQTVMVLPSNQHPERRMLKLPREKLHVRASPQPNPEDPNSAVILYMQVGTAGMKKNLLVDLFVAMVEATLYSQLRTVEQLGYLVCTTGVAEQNLYSVAVVVQGSSRTPLYILSRIYAALDALDTFLEDFPEEEFAGVLRSLIAARQQKPRAQFLEADAMWVEISQRQHMWDRADRESSELYSVTKADVLQLWRSSLSNAAPKRRRLASIIYSAAHAPTYEALFQANPKSTVAVVRTELPTYEEAAKAETYLRLRREIEATGKGLNPEARGQLLALASQHGVDLSSASPQEVLQLSAQLGHSGGSGPTPSPLTSPQLRPTASPYFPGEALLAPLQSVSGSPVVLDLHYVLDTGRFKQTLSAYPPRE